MLIKFGPFRTGKLIVFQVVIYLNTLMKLGLIGWIFEPAC